MPAKIIEIPVLGYDVVVATEIASEILDSVTEFEIAVPRSEVLSTPDKTMVRLWVDDPYQKLPLISKLMMTDLVEYDGIGDVRVVDSE